MKEFTGDDHDSVFENGTRANHIDCVLMATIFHIACSYFNETILSVTDNELNEIERSIDVYYVFNLILINICDHSI